MFRSRQSKFLLTDKYNSGGLMMISAGEFRNGVTFELDGNVVSIIEFQHVKPGKGSAFVRAKIKNISTGSVVERTFNPNEKFKEAFIERREMQYLYNDGSLYYFMDNETFEQFPINKKVLDDNFKFVKENMICKVIMHKNNVFAVEPPFFVDFLITHTDPGFKGDTATNASKLAVLETGAEIKVPLFIEQGEVIRIDTRTSSYMERA
jgi:elongation factor P